MKKKYTIKAKDPHCVYVCSIEEYSPFEAAKEYIEYSDYSGTSREFDVELSVCHGLGNMNFYKAKINESGEVEGIIPL